MDRSTLFKLLYTDFSQNLALADSTFDYGYSIFGLILFPDPLRGLNELYRVLKPNGKVCFTAWPADIPMALIGKRLGEKLNLVLPSGSPVLTPLHLGNPETIHRVMQEAGFHSVEIHQVEHCMVLPHCSEFVKLFASNPALASMRKAVNDNRHFDDMLIETIKEQYPAEPFSLPFKALIAIGTKPDL
jgi:ubiquinone/menaquinone biosynthesis C-methylase UbiE